jgi:hypothetical protein
MIAVHCDVWTSTPVYTLIMYYNQIYRIVYMPGFSLQLLLLAFGQPTSGTPIEEPPLYKLEDLVNETVKGWLAESRIIERQGPLLTLQAR